MKKIINKAHIEGRIYDHKLEMKVSGENSKNPGTKFIAGSIDVATDDACMNVVSVYFTYVTETTKKGGVNATYQALSKIVEGNTKTVMADGAENATMIKIDTAIGLNEWYDKGDGHLVSVRRNEGGFVTLVNSLNNEDERATFQADMIITSCTRVEENEENNTPEKMIVKGAIFDFRNALKPIEFTLYDEAGMDYFEGLEISSKNPVFTFVKGVEVSQTIVTTKTEESAWGEPRIRETKSTKKDFVITWASPNPHEWDSEDTLLASELAEMMSEREVYLADLKKRQDEYQNSKSAPSGFAAAPAKKDYNF